MAHTRASKMNLRNLEVKSYRLSPSLFTRLSMVAAPSDISEHIDQPLPIALGPGGGQVMVSVHLF